MSKFGSISKAPAGSPNQSDGSSSEKVAEAIKLLLSALSVPEQQRILSEISSQLEPIPAPRAGPVLGAVVRLLPQRPEWSVRDIAAHVASDGVEATTKEIYNAMGYLTRKGHVRRVGYGRYLVNGVEIVTLDDLGAEPSRYED